MKQMKMSLENLDVLVNWHMSNPQIWSKLAYTPKVIENYNSKREKAKDVIWCVGEAGWNHLVKNYQKFNQPIQVTTQDSSNQEVMNFTPQEVKKVMERMDMNQVFNRPKINMFKNIEFPNPDWTLQHKIDWYKQKGYKVPNRLKPFVNKVQLGEEIEESKPFSEDYFNSLFD